MLKAKPKRNKSIVHLRVDVEQRFRCLFEIAEKQQVLLGWLVVRVHRSSPEGFVRAADICRLALGGFAGSFVGKQFALFVVLFLVFLHVRQVEQ